MLQNLKKRKEGFTIIEVLIVLAIAGLILLIVFLAVPALQRNSRNTQIKDAAAAILGAVTEYQNNNAGANPTSVTLSGSTLTVSGSGAGTAPAEAKIQGGYTVSLGSAMPSAPGALVVNLGTKCNGNAFGASVARAVSIGYLIETGSGSGSTATQCSES